jgi:hypothetical protein
MVSYKIKYILPGGPVILLSTYPKELKNYVHPKPCTQMLTAPFPNCQNLEGKMSLSEGMISRQWISFCTKKKLDIKPMKYMEAT